MNPLLHSMIQWSDFGWWDQTNPIDQITDRNFEVVGFIDGAAQADPPSAYIERYVGVGVAEELPKVTQVAFWGQGLRNVIALRGQGSRSAVEVHLGNSSTDFQWILNSSRRLNRDSNSRLLHIKQCVDMSSRMKRHWAQICEMRLAWLA